MARKRFNADEKSAFTVGAHVEYRNGSHWHPAVIDGPITVDDITGGFYLPLHVTVTTRTISPAWPIQARPGSVRVPTAAAPSKTTGYPVEYMGHTLWACCVSDIGPACGHTALGLTGLDKIRVKGMAADTMQRLAN